MNKWNNYEIKLKNPSLFTKALLEANINKFWEEIMETLEDNHFVLLILRLKFDNFQIISASTLQKIDRTNKKDIIEYLNNRISLSNEAYTSTPIKSLIFSYGVRSGKLIQSENEISGFLDKSNGDANKNKFQIYYKHKLPIIKSGLISEYGKILNKTKTENGEDITIYVNKDVIIILSVFLTNLSISSIANESKVLSNPSHLSYGEEGGQLQINKVRYIKKGRTIFEWTDRILDNNCVIREIGKSVYYYEDGELSLIKVEKKSKAIKQLKTLTKKSLEDKFITMDLETILINNIHTPYCLSWYDGLKSKSYFIQGLESLENLEREEKILEMIQNVVNDICIRKYRNYKIYLHNFSKFDGYFLVKYLAKIGTCDPIIHKGKIISLKFSSFTQKGDSIYNVTFKDSYLLLPSSLRKLSNSFSIESPKGIFPYGLFNTKYIGVVPLFKYFKGVKKEEYISYKDLFKNKDWDFKVEAIKYCELDCVSLFQILSKFNTLIFERFKLNINKYPTLPSLSFAIFRSQYLKKDSIHMLSGSIANDIREGYTGGACDMYIPTPYTDIIPEGEKVYAYDVNSLYPSVMAKYKLPIGKPTYFSGDITKRESNAFGFFYCNIIAPDNLLHPILQTHVKTKDGIRTVAPLGSWSDMLFSEEMYNAKKFGYKFEILWGYTFEKDFVFDKFVVDMYKIRLLYPKSDPMNYIAKILMNSLYGRFGMDDNFISSIILNKGDYDKFEKLDKDNSIIQCKSPKVELDTLLDNGNEVHNINISIATAITAYARIHMSQFKNGDSKDFKLFYSDTDSAYTNKPLPQEFIGDGLGLLKLEYNCKDAVFLAPKVIALLTEENELIMKIKGLIIFLYLSQLCVFTTDIYRGP